MEKNFSFGGRDFQMRKLDAMKQFHIVRRIGPILGEILPAIKGGDFAKFSTAKAVEALPEEKKFEMMAQFVGPVMNGLSKLSDEDANIVLYGLLSCVEIKQAGGNWASISTGNMLMIQDLEFPALMQIAGRSFIFNLSGFFTALPQ